MAESLRRSNNASGTRSSGSRSSGTGRRSTSSSEQNAVPSGRSSDSRSSGTGRRSTSSSEQIAVPSGRSSDSRSSGTGRRSMKSSGQIAVPTGLRSVVQQRLLKDVFAASSAKFSGWMILVVDNRAMRVVSSAIGMYDIMESNVSLVEDIEKMRAPFKDMGAIYLLSQTEESVDRLIADFENPLYGSAAFVYFLGPLPNHLLDKIRQCRPLIKRLKGLGEINVDFLAKEERAYHLDMRSSFQPIYLRNQRKIETIMAEKLVTVCATLNEYPYIRYPQESASCNVLAKMFHSKMDEFLRMNDDWWYHGDSSHTDRSRGTLLLLDRKDDCLSPLMHDFTYQSMVYDLLNIEDDKVSYKSETFTSDKGPMKMTDKDVLLNDNDTLWVELRSMHIADVIQTLSARIREMVNSDTSGLAQKDKGKTMSLTQMANALKALPEYREVMSKLSQHMHLSHECMDLFRKDGLLQLSELEQTLATGKRDDGRTPKLADMVDEVALSLEEMSNPLAKARLLMIFIVSQNGIKPEHKARLFKAASLSGKLEKTVHNLEVLDVPIVNSGEKKSKIRNLFGAKMNSIGATDEDSEYSSSRYLPPLKDILTQLAQNQLSIEEYPSVLPLPENMVRASGTAQSARRRSEANNLRGSTTARWQRSIKSDGKSGDSFSGERQLVFVVGGLCFSELRVAREVQAKEGKEIILGSTHFTNPSNFMQDVSKLG